MASLQYEVATAKVSGRRHTATVFVVISSLGEPQAHARLQAIDRFDNVGAVQQFSQVLAGLLCLSDARVEHSKSPIPRKGYLLLVDVLLQTTS
ncbi:hypothetical protein [Tardiphaga sp. 1201_B9_N1_2]|jgi:hypothetical protein|uniref:hypothetical protein n=1 Tax=unclassified Tardiphaga TaxID=2631404 RepID=UPI003F248CEF